MTQAKDYSYLIGEKIGYLTVLEILPPGTVIVRPGRRTSVARCVCKCGKECFKEPTNLERRMGITCGSNECKNQIRRESHKFNRQIHPKSEYAPPVARAAEKFPRTTNAVLFQKLKTKYECPYPARGCVRSEICRVCCLECDKPCKQCSNRPELCGARRR